MRREKIVVMNIDLAEMARRVCAGEAIDRSEALELLETQGAAAVDLLACANHVRHHFHGDAVQFCSIVNARSGACGEDCRFCAQSARSSSNTPVYPLVEDAKIALAADRAFAAGATEFCIVTSGRGPHDDAEFERIVEMTRRLSHQGRMRRCASLGLLTPAMARRLAEAGLQRFNHNIECSERFFPNLCTTHTWSDRVATIRALKQAGIEVCSGVILGVGETLEDRVDAAYALRDLEVDSVPMNFLSPIPGTPLENAPRMRPMEILKSIAVYRLILPRAEIRSCGGREANLRTLQPLMYLAGANGTMIGDYLTTPGRPAAEDVEMVRDLELRVAEYRDSENHATAAAGE